MFIEVVPWDVPQIRCCVMYLGSADSYSSWANITLHTGATSKYTIITSHLSMLQQTHTGRDDPKLVMIAADPKLANYIVLFSIVSNGQTAACLLSRSSTYH